MPFLIADSLGNFSVAPQGQFVGCAIRMAQVPDLSRGVCYALNLTSAGPNAGARFDWRPGSTFTVGDGDTIEFWAYLETPLQWPNGDPASGAQGYIYLSDTNFANCLTAFFCLRRGWNHIRIGRNQFSTLTGSPTWQSNFSVMRVAMIPCSAGAISAYFGEFRKGGKDQPLISIVFDDGEDTVRQYAMPIMSQVGIPMTLALISGNVGRTLGTRTFSSLSQLGEFPGDTSFVNHTKSHMKGILDSRKVAQNVLLAEIQDCQNFFAGLPGFDPAMFCAPYGEWSERYIAALQESGVKASRSIVSGSGPGYWRHTGSRLDNPYLMPSFCVATNQSPTDVLAFVDEGIAAAQSMIITFHDIRPTATATTDYPLANFQAIMDGLNSRMGQAEFVTMPQFVKQLRLNGLT